jgi:caffeoyl-CoA O-methyltransferase
MPTRKIVNPGGLIIADNVLWSGKVLEEANTQDEETRALRDYSEKVNADVRVESMLLPVRDGLMICRKK